MEGTAQFTAGLQPYNTYIARAPSDDFDTSSQPCFLVQLTDTKDPLAFAQNRRQVLLAKLREHGGRGLLQRLLLLK